MIDQRRTRVWLVRLVLMVISGVACKDVVQAVWPTPGSERDGLLKITRRMGHVALHVFVWREVLLLACLDQASALRHHIP